MRGDDIDRPRDRVHSPRADRGAQASRGGAQRSGAAEAQGGAVGGERPARCRSPRVAAVSAGRRSRRPCVIRASPRRARSAETSRGSMGASPTLSARSSRCYTWLERTAAGLGEAGRLVGDGARRSWVVSVLFRARGRLSRVLADACDHRSGRRRALDDSETIAGSRVDHAGRAASRAASHRCVDAIDLASRPPREHACAGRRGRITEAVERAGRRRGMRVRKSVEDHLDDDGDEKAGAPFARSEDPRTPGARYELSTPHTLRLRTPRTPRTLRPPGPSGPRDGS